MIVIRVLPLGFAAHGRKLSSFPQLLCSSHRLDLRGATPFNPPVGMVSLLREHAPNGGLPAKGIAERRDRASERGRTRPPGNELGTVRSEVRLWRSYATSGLDLVFQLGRNETVAASTRLKRDLWVPASDRPSGSKFAFRRWRCVAASR